MHAVGALTELSNVCDFYKDDIPKMQLQAQLPLLQALFAEEKSQPELSINDIIKSLSQISSAQRLVFSNVWVLTKILLVMPAPMPLQSVLSQGCEE